MGAWVTYSLKKQLLIVFSTFTIVSMVAVGLACIIFIAVTGNNVHDNLYNGFLNTSQVSIAAIITNGAQLFDMKLSQLTRNFPNVMATNAEDSFRTDYPFSQLASHYNWPGQLPNQFFSSRYNAQHYLHGVVYQIYGVNYTNLHNQPAYILNIVDKTVKWIICSPNFCPQYGFLAGHMSTPKQFLRYYPGAVKYQNRRRTLHSN